MATPISATPTLVKRSLKSDAGSTRLDFADFRFQLSNRLQSSLDLLEVLNHFHYMMQYRVPSSGVDYRYPEKHIHLSIGSSRAHNVSYTLTADTQYLGEMTFYRARRFAEHELHDIETLIGLLVLPLRNALLYRDALEHSLRDPLTELGNRTAMDKALEREFKLAKRARQNLSLVIADIDFFKKVNDTAGHSMGDLLIKKTAQAIQKAARETDQIFRFGGEEYVVILNETHHQHGMKVAERMRCAAAAITIPSKAGPISATMSLGVSTLRDNDSLQTLFERADHALYQAKANGRNAVVSAENGIEG